MLKYAERVHERLDIYRVKVPLPGSPLKYLNSYMIPCNDTILVVDVGLNTSQSERLLRNALYELFGKAFGVTFLITHLHADHCGLLERISTANDRILVSREDSPFVAATLDWSGFWEKSKEFARSYGFPPDRLKKAIEHHPGYLFGLKQKPKGRFEMVEDGYCIGCGAMCFQVMKTPGHTPGHICLYDKVNGILISGDHVLFDITPNIAAGYENMNPLGDYLKSLSRVENLHTTLVLPGHRRLFDNLKERVGQLKRHHEERLNEALGIVKRFGPVDAYTVASHMSWDIESESFDQFPITQQWFAHCEAIAHLLYLRDVGRLITRQREDGVILFEIST